MDKSFYTIFKTFFKVGTLLLGGGYVILPLLQAELVDKKGWIDSDGLCEYYALGQSVPGIIAANMSIFVGYKLRGQVGALAAVLGIVTPAFLAIILVASILEEIVHWSFIQSIFWGVGIGVILLVYLATKEMWTRSIVDKFTCIIFFAAFILSSCFKVSPALIIILSIAAGIIYRKRMTAEKAGNKECENDLS